MTHGIGDCRLCGDRRDIRVGLVEWQQDYGTGKWDWMPRCRDHLACRARVEAAGEEWPLRDNRTGK
jgi:hypothetical protein